MSSRKIQYDIMAECTNPAPAPKMPMEIWLKRRIQIRETWEQLFGDAEERQYDYTMYECTLQRLEQQDLAGFPQLTGDIIEEAIMKLIETDDWAYELAYGKKRIWPLPEKKGRSRRSRKVHPRQIAMVI